MRRTIARLLGARRLRRRAPRRLRRCSSAPATARYVLSFQQDDDIRNVPVTLPTIQSVSPIHFLTLGASLRDRATLPSPLRGLGPSGGYPSRLRSLRSLRAPLARRVLRIRERRLASAAPRLVRSLAAAAALRFRSRNRFPFRSVPWVWSSGRPSAARLSHPTHLRCRARPICAAVRRDAQDYATAC